MQVTIVKSAAGFTYLYENGESQTCSSFECGDVNERVGELLGG